MQQTLKEAKKNTVETEYLHETTPFSCYWDNSDIINWLNLLVCMNFVMLFCNYLVSLICLIAFYLLIYHIGINLGCFSIFVFCMMAKYGLLEK